MAPYTYFQRAGIYAGEQKPDEMVALMRQFIEKYPQSDKIYFAYDSIAQNQINAMNSDQLSALVDLLTYPPALPAGPGRRNGGRV